MLTRLLLLAASASLVVTGSSIAPAADTAQFMTTHRFAETNASLEATVNCVTEIEFELDMRTDNPRINIEINASVFDETSKTHYVVPAFWAGGQIWKLRYAPASLGVHTFRLTSNDRSLGNLAGYSGKIRAKPYSGTNSLLKHGPITMAARGRHLAHADGTPFFLLADSWWHAMTSRLSDSGLETLVADRKRKGFNTIQFAVANPCDVEPFDDRGGNTGGHPWTKDFVDINPAYWDAADERVEYLVNHEIVPSVMGSWAYYVHFMGDEKMRQHWRYVVARYGAFPVCWILCGESRLPWYPLIKQKTDDGYKQTLRWTELSHYVRSINYSGRLLGIHPGPPLWFHNAPYAPLSDYSSIDIYYGMGGHGGRDKQVQMAESLEVMKQWRKENPGKPAMIGELLWEGMYGGDCDAMTQRRQFWFSVLNGSPGHCYGADAIWQMNSDDQLFGESASGFTWGNWTWQEAMHWKGSMYVSVAKRIIGDLPWTEFEPHPEWLSQTKTSSEPSRLIAAAAGIPGKVRCVYVSRKEKVQLQRLDPKKQYRLVYISPIDGRSYPSKSLLTADAEGNASISNGPINQDWVLVVRPVGEE